MAWWIFTVPNTLGFVLIFFILAIVNRQLNNLGVPFNKWAAFLMFLPYFIIDTFGSFKWAFIIGLFGGIIVGVIAGMMLGGDDGDSE